jgi:hypothetical protein
LATEALLALAPGGTGTTNSNVSIVCCSTSLLKQLESNTAKTTVADVSADYDAFHLNMKI